MRVGRQFGRNGAGEVKWIRRSTRGRNEVAEHALTRELGASARTSHHHLPDGFSSANDRV
jgi:hypothetical protein